MLVRGAGGWTLRLEGEPDAAVDLADHDPDRRAALADADGVGRVLIAPSVPLGIEALPASEAEPLLEAYHEGAAALPAPFGAWAAIGVDAPDPAALARLLDEGFAGACVGADALAGPAGYERLGPLLEALERAEAPLLIHPGPAARAARRAALVVRAHRLRRGDAHRLVRLRRLGPAGAPGAACVLRDARRPGAAAPRAADGPRRRRAAADRRRVPRRLVLRSTAPSTRWCARSASTRSSSAPTVPSSRPASCRSATRCAPRSASATPSGCSAALEVAA